MKKRIFVFILAVLCFMATPCGLLAVVADEPEATAIISAESMTVQTGSTIDVIVEISNNPGIAALSLNAQFDDGLTLVGAANGSAFSELSFTKPNQLKNGGGLTGSCQFVWFGSENVTEDGELLRLTFAVSDSIACDTECNITLSCSENDSLNEKREPVALDFVNSVITVIDYIPGDVDGNGIINMQDVLTLSQYYVDGCKYDPEGYAVSINENAGDVNGDGVLNMMDILMLCQYYVDGCKYDPDGYGVQIVRGRMGCKHPLTEIEAVPPTCTRDGNIACWYCPECNQCYSDAQGRHKISFSSVILPAIGHSLSAWIPETEREEGHYHCYNCGKNFDANMNEMASQSKTLKFGMGVAISAATRDADMERNGSCEVNSTVAVITVDAGGKVVACKIDVAQIKGSWDCNGIAYGTTDFRTKVEKGTDYGMSKIGKKEWFEQAAVFESVVVGKTLDEIKALVAEGGKGTEAVITAGCTITVSDFVSAIEKAFANLADSSATAVSTLKLGMATEQPQQMDAAVETDGKIEFDTTIFAAAVDVDGKIVAVDTDCVQIRFTFDSIGISTFTEPFGGILSKRQKGDAYGISKIGKTEWYAQADAFETQCMGKTIAEVATLVVESGKGTEAVQAAGCTITVSGFVAAAAKVGQSSIPKYYVRDNDEDIYEAILGEYEELINAAKSASSIDERFVLFAKAEAYLLDQAVMTPTTTQGGAYNISRIAPHTVPYVQWGNDDDRVKSLVIANEFITKTDREALLDLWAKACTGEGVYDPAAYLTAHGYTLKNEYKTTFLTAPVTFDWLNTWSEADTEILVNTVDGLVEYDNLNRLQPALATSWEISEDGLTYTFHIREGVYWYTAEGTAYAELTAEDFEAGFRHMLDTQAGYEWLVEGVVKGVGNTYVIGEDGNVAVDEEGDDIVDVAGYLYGGEWENVGYKATDKYTLTITLEQPTSYFATMLTYSCFLPMCKSFYLSKGGVFGVDAYRSVVNYTDDYGEITFADSYTYGVNTSVANQVYCGAFLIQQFSADSQIVLVKNPNYYNADKVTMNTLTWVYDNGEDPLATYNDVINGVYPGTGLTEATGTLAKAKEEKLKGDTETIFEKYAYVSDTNSTTYFGGLNLNRGTYALASGACASTKTEQQKIGTHTAMQNKNFRQALLFAFDRITWNAVNRGSDLAATNLRNMYCHPQFVSLSADVTVDGKTWGAGTFYGEMVQYYLEQLGSHIKVADQQDGWFNADLAKEKLAAAKTELTAAGVTFPITIDLVYYSGSPSQIAQAQAYKQGIEEVLGAENVVVNLIEATTPADYYASGYRARNGAAGNFDIFYGSGWGPDYGDPSTYLDTFLGYGVGYMTKFIGLF